MNINTFYTSLAAASTTFSALPFVVGLICIKHIKEYLIPLFLIVVVSLITDVINYILINSHINNLYVFHIFTFIEFTLICFFYKIFFSKYFNSVYLLLFIPGFLIVALIDYKINGLRSMDNFSSSVESILLSLFALFSFFFVMQKMIFENILSTPFFWINSGILLYFSGNLLYFTFSNYLHTTESSNHLAVWMISSFLNIFYNILISIGFWKAKTR